MAVGQVGATASWCPLGPRNTWGCTTEGEGWWSVLEMLFSCQHTLLAFPSFSDCGSSSVVVVPYMCTVSLSCLDLLVVEPGPLFSRLSLDQQLSNGHFKLGRVTAQLSGSP